VFLVCASKIEKIIQFGAKKARSRFFFIKFAAQKKSVMLGQNSFLSNITPVVKKLLIINAGVLLLAFLYTATSGVEATHVIGLFYVKSEAFRPFQIVTHMFMHANFIHLFFNMYALWLFGQILERVWGGKRFLIYYLITGFGAAALHFFVVYLRSEALMADMSAEEINLVLERGHNAILSQKNFVNSQMAELNGMINVPTVGASGAVFGVLLAFGMFFPNIELYFIFIPVPIKAKYLVIGYGALELFNGIANTPGDNIAHFAHLGGMLFGFILIKIWGKPTGNFY
jgi:membrane associated rhomboid family serine protease